MTPKVTSTPLLEFVKARRADKLRTQGDRNAEKRKREIEKRKAREDARISVKHGKTADGDGDISASPQIKVPTFLFLFMISRVLDGLEAVEILHALGLSLAALQSLIIHPFYKNISVCFPVLGHC